MLKKLISGIILTLSVTVCLAQAEIDFGKRNFKFKDLDSGRVYYYDFTFENTGNTPLVITFVRMTNKNFCRVEYPRHSINSGEKSYIRLYCNLKHFPNERITSSFMVYSNCPAPANLKIIEFSADVIRVEGKVAKAAD